MPRYFVRESASYCDVVVDIATEQSKETLIARFYETDIRPIFPISALNAGKPGTMMANLLADLLNTCPGNESVTTGMLLWRPQKPEDRL